MKSFVKILGNEEGSMIVVVMLILVIVTILGFSATRTSVMEQKIATNDQLHKISFYAAESGAYAASKLLSNCLNYKGLPSGTATLTTTSAENSYDSTILSFTDTTAFYNMMMGYATSSLDGIEDTKYEFGDSTASLDMARYGTSSSVIGGSAEFATAADGAGSSSIGGVQMHYGIDSTGQAGRGSSVTVNVTYRKVSGVPGGL